MLLLFCRRWVGFAIASSFRNKELGFCWAFSQGRPWVCVVAGKPQRGGGGGWTRRAVPCPSIHPSIHPSSASVSKEIEMKANFFPPHLSPVREGGRRRSERKRFPPPRGSAVIKSLSFEKQREKRSVSNPAREERRNIPLPRAALGMEGPREDTADPSAGCFFGVGEDWLRGAVAGRSCAPLLSSCCHCSSAMTRTDFLSPSTPGSQAGEEERGDAV